MWNDEVLLGGRLSTLYTLPMVAKFSSIAQLESISLPSRVCWLRWRGGALPIQLATGSHVVERKYPRVMWYCSKLSEADREDCCHSLNWSSCYHLRKFLILHYRKLAELL